jgi:putative ABC transport system permease protein
MKNHQPPKLARKLFEWYCGYAPVDDLLGDLDEWFHKTVKTKSVFKAKLLYWKQIFQLVVSYAIRKRKRDSKFGPFGSNSISFSMFQNYLTVSGRSLYRHKYFSIVNALGLSIGMCVGLLLIAMFSYVLSYDDFHTNRENIYRIISTRQEGIESRDLASVPSPLLERLQTEFNGIEKSTRMYSSFYGEAILEKENLWLNGFYAEPTFLSLFHFPFERGNASTALVKPNSLVLTQSLAKKIFNKTDVLGQSIDIKGLGLFEITGVLVDPPKNTHLEFDLLASYSSLPQSLGDVSNHMAWRNYRNNYLYIQLPKKFDRENLQQALKKIAASVYPADATVKATFQLQSLGDINPGPDLSNEPGPKWDYLGFTIFGIIALLILLPACFNYTNISIARALKRSKEIGLRKTMGGLKNHIFVQFITETVIITSISLLGALLLFFLVRSEFQSMLVEASSLDLSLNWLMIALFGGFALLTGLMAGFFPALYFAGLNPVQALKSQSVTKGFSGMRLRKGLTIFQFALSFMFILGLVVFSRQYRYTLNFDFGFQKENIMHVDLLDVKPDKFKSSFEKLSAVQNISMSSNILGIGYLAAMVHPFGKIDSTEVFQLYVDEQYINNMELTLLAGENFPEGVWQREQHMLVNEEFLKKHNIKSPVDALGQTFTVEGNDLEIIGVLKDFHFASLQVPIKSFMFRMNPNQFKYANMRVSFTDAFAGITEMELQWKTLSQEPIQAKFFNDEIDEAYSYYQTFLKIVGFLGLLAISISLLGMLGMVVYTSEQRTKEVGIRKVMGASTTGIAMLLSKDYARLMIWAFVIAIPLAVLISDRVLISMQYYSVRLNVWDILISILLLMFLGLVTIASQTFKTANTNPAETLKSE